MGKTDKRRPAAVDREQVDRNWARTFGERQPARQLPVVKRVVGPDGDGYEVYSPTEIPGIVAEDFVTLTRRKPMEREALMTAEAIARVCHEANRALCLAFGDVTQPAWEAAPEWQRESAIEGVVAIRDGRVTRPEDSHESWMEQKRAQGWRWGPEKDPENKTHPCMVHFESLTREQKVKDYVFLAVAKALLGR